MPISRSTSRRRRVSAAIALVFVAAGCSGSDLSEGDAFCAEAAAFQEFQLGVAEALFDPERTEAFFAESVDRMNTLTDLAPPTVHDEVREVRASYVALDDALAEVGYSVILVDEAALDTSDTEGASNRINEFLDAACRSEGDPIRGFADDPFAPLVLSNAEIDQLRDSVDEESGEMEAIVSTQLAEEFGLSAEDARCIVDGLDVSFISALAAGDTVSEEDSARFVEVLAECGVGVEQLTG